VTPALDESTGELVETLCATDRHVAVVTPDITDRETIGKTVTRIERRLTLARLRAAGATVCDWDTRFPLARAMEAAT
jgi:hypothetical protein